MEKKRERQRERERESQRWLWWFIVKCYWLEVGGVQSPASSCILFVCWSLISTVTFTCSIEKSLPGLGVSNLTMAFSSWLLSSLLLIILVFVCIFILNIAEPLFNNKPPESLLFTNGLLSVSFCSLLVSCCTPTNKSLHLKY